MNRGLRRQPDYDRAANGTRHSGGNGDCSQMSAWFGWSAIGFYLFSPVGGIYLIRSPLVAKVVIRLGPKFYPGDTFTIVARGASRQNCCIQSAKLNGQSLNHPWIFHGENSKGGILEFEMGIQPNNKQGTHN